jgi:hypothetical protein
MPETSRPQKITFGEIRECGIGRLLIYCADYKCSHSIQMSEIVGRTAASPLPPASRGPL